MGVQVSSNSKVQPAIQMSRECMHAKVLNKLTLWPRLPRVLQAKQVFLMFAMQYAQSVKYMCSAAAHNTH